MNRIAKAAGLTLFALMALSVPASAQIDVTGKWTFQVAAPDGSVQSSTVELTQDGSDVVGTVMNPMAGTAERAEGKLEGNVLTFLVTTDMNGTPVTIEVTAEVDGDDMTGNIVMAEFGTIPFTAKRDGG